MTTPRPSTRKEKKEATRRALVAAALEAFCADGISATSIARITGAAGVAPGTFYVHFESKEALLEAARGEFADGLIAVLGPVLAGVRRPLNGLLTQAAEVYLRYYREHRTLVLAYARQLSLGPDELRSGLNPASTAALEAVLGQRLRPGLRADFATRGLIGMWVRVALLASLDDEPGAHEDAVRVLVTMSGGALSALGITNDGEEPR